MAGGEKTLCAIAESEGSGARTRNEINQALFLLFKRWTWALGLGCEVRLHLISIYGHYTGPYWLFKTFLFPVFQLLLIVSSTERAVQFSSCSLGSEYQIPIALLQDKT